MREKIAEGYTEPLFLTQVIRIRAGKSTILNYVSRTRSALLSMS